MLLDLVIANQVLLDQLRILTKLFPRAHPECAHLLAQVGNQPSAEPNTKRGPKGVRWEPDRSVTESPQRTAPPAAAIDLEEELRAQDSVLGSDPEQSRRATSNKGLLPASVVLYSGDLDDWKASAAAVQNLSWVEVEERLSELRVRLQRLGSKPIIASDVLGAQVYDFISYGSGVKVAIFLRKAIAQASETVLVGMLFNDKTIYYELPLHLLSQDLVTGLVKHAAAQ